MKTACFILGLLIFFNCVSAQAPAFCNLSFDSLAARWDEAIPLGNGWLGALIWKKEGKLRMSLDRVDLWDDRPMPDINKLKFQWVQEQVKKNQYDTVQKLGDEPYEKYPAPTKIPAAALEFDFSSFGKVISNTLFIENGLSVVEFANHVRFNNYIHATKNTGYFGFEQLNEKINPEKLIPELIAPAYTSGKNGIAGNSVEGQSLERLGYAKGTITRTANSIRYHQPTWKKHFYEVLVQWFALSSNGFIGQWTITMDKPAFLPPLIASAKEPTGWNTHTAWWKNFWNRSSISIPDSSLLKQYYLDMYKFACVARSNTPAITLQAIWTADNGNLPPWKGDFHHDLNTELSYWPGYASNHLDLTASYTNWLWKTKEENKRWTKNYFGVDGLNVPGVNTITGKPMGGWIQYSMSPTTVCWLAQHFYWQWKFGMNKDFLETRLRPYVEDAVQFIGGITSNSGYALPLSSSPEYHDNNIHAWFTHYTNYDLSLVRYLQKIYQSLPPAMDASKKTNTDFSLRGYPAFDVNETGLTIAPGQNLEESHHHHAQLMAIYPLCELDADDSAQHQIIDKSLRWLEKQGTRNWCGYSFSWAACIYARAKEAEHAVNQLKIFASNFVSPNSFHLNGDQKGGQYSNFTYRPFTLEGNFAFAQGVQELLLQTRNGHVEIFPAIPERWKNVSFTTLRTEGAFLVSAKKVNGVVTEVKIFAEQGGMLKIKLPFTEWDVKGVAQNKIHIRKGIAEMQTAKGAVILFHSANAAERR